MPKIAPVPFPRKRESTLRTTFWIPAFRGNDRKYALFTKLIARVLFPDLSYEESERLLNEVVKILNTFLNRENS